VSGFEISTRNAKPGRLVDKQFNRPGVGANSHRAAMYAPFAAARVERVEPASKAGGKIACPAC